MPKLFDLLSERTDKDALKQIQKRARKKTPQKKRPQRSRDTAPKKRIKYTTTIFIPEYIAVDVETTGLDAKNDRIIEIGAIRFRHGKPSDEFHSLVNPNRPIPANIIELTSISDQMVVTAPLFEEIVNDLVAFIGRFSLCGHQVEFDFNFINAELKRAGKEPLQSKLLDTAILARLLLHGLPGYSLANVSRHLGVPQKNAHRALDDALVAGNVAGMLIPKIGDISVRIRAIMERFAPYSLLKTILQKSIAEKEIPLFEQTVVFFKPPQRLSIPEEPEPVESETVEDCFSEKGELAAEMETYVSRPSQIKMALGVANALNNQTCFVAEAGTGTGKSFAYLIPAAFWAHNNECRILVSTHTKNLQDQLVSKDLPIVSKVTGKGFRYSILKGRSNYLCRYRWRQFLAGELGNLSARDRLGILPLIRWAEETTTGDIEEQNQFNRRWYAKVWSLVSAESHGCLGRRCSLFNACFLQYARQKALGSHIVVINHALFFSEVCAESSFLGKASTIIFDEAHHLESCGHRHLRVELDTNRIKRYIESMNNLMKVLEKNLTSEEAIGWVRKYKNILKRLRKNSSQFLSDVASWVEREFPQDEQNTNVSNYTYAYRDTPFSGSSGLAGFELVVKDIQDVLFSLQDISTEHGDKDSILCSEIAGCQEKTSQLKADGIYLTNACTDDHVFWVEGDRQKGWVKLCGVPLDIGGLLHTIWSDNSGATIFTSATMTVSGSIDYFKRKVGLVDDLEERTEFESFKSPFSDKQMLPCAVSSSLLPDSQGYAAYIAEVVIRLLNAFDRNILVLFTANSMLYTVHGCLKHNANFPEDGIFFTQGLSGTRATLLEKFKESKKSVLLGTASFWEGIDAPGEACEIVIMPRLPFPVPNHPLTYALAERVKEQYGDSFYNFSVPEAVIKFRQGAGRLIRTGSDKGAFIVLDGRIVAKPYGKVFTRSLDSEFITCPDVDNMLEQVSAFFKGVV